MRRRLVGLCILSNLAGLAAGGCTSYRSGVGYGASPGIAPSAYEHYILGRLAAERGDHETAIAELRQASASAPEQSEPRLAIGDELLVAGHTDGARREASYAIREWPADPGAWRLLGRVRGASTDMAGAAEAFERSLA